MPARCVWLHGVARRFALLLLPRSPASAPALACYGHAKATPGQAGVPQAGFASPHPAGPSSVTVNCDLLNGADLRWIQAMLGHRSVESTQIYTQVSIRALQAVHASTHPAEQREEKHPDKMEKK